VEGHRLWPQVSSRYSLTPLGEHSQVRVADPLRPLFGLRLPTHTSRMAFHDFASVTTEFQIFRFRLYAKDPRPQDLSSRTLYSLALASTRMPRGSARLPSARLCQNYVLQAAYLWPRTAPPVIPSHRNTQATQSSRGGVLTYAPSR
jgi:hypothetical protein